MELAPQIGLVVPTFNRFKTSKRFLGLLSQQTYENFTVYISDSGSTDGTREYATRIPFVKLVEADTDDWWTGATNKGITQALIDKCEFVMTINDDALFSNDFITNLVSVFNTQPEMDICAARVDFAHQPGKIWSLGAYTNWGTRNMFQLGYQDVWADKLPYDIQNQTTIPADALCGNGVLIRSKVFDKIGLYSESWCPHYHADSEFILRANRKKMNVQVCTNIVLYNDIEDHSLGKLNEDVEQIEKKKTTFLRREYKTVKNIFFSKKSNLYLKPFFYVTFRYCPFFKIPKHLFVNLFHWFYIFYGQRILTLVNDQLANGNKRIYHFFQRLYIITSSKWNSLNSD